MIKFKHTGDFKKTNKFLEKMKDLLNIEDFDTFGSLGVEALKESTPRDTGKTADSWTYKVVHEKGRVRLVWTNTNENQGVKIAILLQYGHGLPQGGYIQGIDYINPAMRPVFDKISKDAWEVVRKA